MYTYGKKTCNHVRKVLLFEEPSLFPGLPRFHVCSKACPSGYSLYSSAGSEVTWDLKAICIVWYAWYLEQRFLYTYLLWYIFCKIAGGNLNIFSDSSLWVLLDMDMYKLIWDFVVNLISRPFFMDVYLQRNPPFLCWQNNSSANKLHPFLTAHRGDHESLP